MAAEQRTGSTRRWRVLRARILRGHPLCGICTKELATEIDHVVPVSRGGAMWDIANLQPACFACNRSKGTGCPARWDCARGSAYAVDASAVGPRPLAPGDTRGDTSGPCKPDTRLAYVRFLSPPLFQTGKGWPSEAHR
ncbi:MAG: HNH endonuclease signature motif containing protein [Nocardioidaceae bacterium]